jgi:hypothetical protein
MTDQFTPGPYFQDEAWYNLLDRMHITLYQENESGSIHAVPIAHFLADTGERWTDDYDNPIIPPCVQANINLFKSAEKLLAVARRIKAVLRQSQAMEGTSGYWLLANQLVHDADEAIAIVEGEKK